MASLQEADDQYSVHILAQITNTFISIYYYFLLTSIENTKDKFENEHLALCFSNTDRTTFAFLFCIY